MREYIHRVGIAMSILLNVILGGKPYQTFSARNYQWRREGKPNLVTLIDGIFHIFSRTSEIVLTNDSGKRKVIFTSHHCLHSWACWRTRKDIIHEYSGEIENGKRQALSGQVCVEGCSFERVELDSGSYASDYYWCR